MSTLSFSSKDIGKTWWIVDANGKTIPGLFAAGEVAGFGGGGYHGYNALEGTFLGGCIFSGRQVGRADSIA